MRDLLAQREQAERTVSIYSSERKYSILDICILVLFNILACVFYQRLAETLDADIRRWSNGKEGNLRALLSTLQYVRTAIYNSCSVKWALNFFFNVFYYFAFMLLINFDLY